MNEHDKIELGQEFVLTKSPPDWCFPSEANRHSYDRHIPFSDYPVTGFVQDVIMNDIIRVVVRRTPRGRGEFLANFHRRIYAFKHFDWLVT